MDPTLSSSPIVINASDLDRGDTLFLECSLPYDPVMAEKGAAIVESVDRIFKTLMQPNVKALRGGVESFVKILIDIHQVGQEDLGLFGIDLRVAQGALEVLYGDIAAFSQKEIRPLLSTFLDQLSEYNRLFKTKTIKLVVKGDSEDINLLTENLSDELSELVDQFRQELADRYDWKRGQASDSEDMGFIPPSGAKLRPVLDSRDLTEQKNDDPMLAAIKKQLRETLGI